MSSGIQLSLMIGPAVPIPVPQAVVDALTSVEVNSYTDQAGAFRLNFELSNRSRLHTLFLLTAGKMLPIMRVVIAVTLSGKPAVLMDGVVTEQKVTPGSQSGHSTLELTGVDLTAVMSLIDFDGFPFPSMPLGARVAVILGKYAFLGVIPLIIPPLLMDVPIPVKSIPRQQGNDLDYIRLLSEEVGYVFYIEPGPRPGRSVAYWGPEIKVGIPQPALNLDMDAHTNVESLRFTFNKEKRTLPVVFIHNQLTKVPIPIPIPNINLLNPPLGLVPPLPTKIKFAHSTAKLSAVQAAARGLSRAASTSDAVSGTGTLNVARYGRVLKARRLVGVRGAGLAFDGLYYVKSVTHQIKRGEYKQDFTLSRNGLVSIAPRVPV